MKRSRTHIYTHLVLYELRMRPFGDQNVLASLHSLLDPADQVQQTEPISWTVEWIAQQLGGLT
jgi:hypothetical protein